MTLMQMEVDPVTPIEVSVKDSMDLKDDRNSDLLVRFKTLLTRLENIKTMESLIKEEYSILKKEYAYAQEEVKRLKCVPLYVGQLCEVVNEDHAIVSSTHTGYKTYVRILSTVDRELLKPNTSIALHRNTLGIVDVLPADSDNAAQLVSPDRIPDVKYSDVGGLDMQKQELRETVELPLTHHHLYKQLGIDPPRGVLLYGPPGTGKTMLAKAVAHHTKASFIKAVGSEFIQKYLGEGPRMIRDIFRLARQHAPSIIFIDEIDSIASKRFDAHTGVDREVQRILLELLNQMDGFEETENVKVIMATNRADILDPALLRPGRLDRKIELPVPDRRQKRLIFAAITTKMNISDDVDLEDFVSRPEKISGAEINAICIEAGMQAVREHRYLVTSTDFEKAYKICVKKETDEFQFYK